MVVWCFVFFKQKPAYEMLISDWSSDVCSSDLVDREPAAVQLDQPTGDREAETGTTAMPRLQGVATQERIAGRGDLVGCHADPGVADGDDRRVLLTPEIGRAHV